MEEEYKLSLFYIRVIRVIRELISYCRNRIVIG